MNKIWVGLAGLLVVACQESETTVKDFTGNEVVYSLEKGPVYDVEGTVTFKEKKDGSTLVIVDLSGTSGSVEHPVHLHLGNISTPDADIAALLSPVNSKTGKSETILTQLSDESSIRYSDLINLEACIKVHVAAFGPDQDVILAGGNIGSAVYSESGGRIGMSVCKSE